MSSQPDTLDDDLHVLASDGRVPGPRGQQTRERLLAATVELLKTNSYRDLKVVEIARAAGTSPATFYQYFSDVEAAVLLLGQRMVEDAGELTAPVEASTWTGRSAYDAALALVDAFLDFWRSHEPVLRVVDLAIVEGERRFREIRNKLLFPITTLLAKIVQEHKDAGRHGRDVDPTAQAAVLVSMLAHVAEHRRGKDEWGIDRDDIRQAMARVVATSIMGRLPR